MYQFKDIGGLTRVAIGVTWVSMVTNALADGSNFYAVTFLDRSPDERATWPDVAPDLLNLFVLIVSFILIGRWIYRASANAHTLTADLPISPGWAVGWYFVPVANLWKPFEGMKQIWLASHYGSNWEGGVATDLLNWWWGLWILDGVLNNASWRLGSKVPQFAADIDLVEIFVDIALSLILIRIMRQIRDAQKVTRHAEVFA